MKPATPPPTHLRPTVRRETMTVADLVELMNSAYEEGFQEAAADGEDEENCHLSGVTAWRAMLPLLSTRAAVQMYIAVVAHGVARSRCAVAAPALTRMEGAPLFRAGHGRQQQRQPWTPTG